MDEIKAGTYRLREAFVNSKIDKRRARSGFKTEIGLPKGTRVVIGPWWGDDKGKVLVIECPDIFRAGNDIVLHSQPGGLLEHQKGCSWALGWLTTEEHFDLARFIGLLEPADDDLAWLRTRMEASRRNSVDAEDIVLELLAEGVIRRDHIERAIERYDARERNDQ
jgi:hypothetical protein